MYVCGCDICVSVDVTCKPHGLVYALVCVAARVCVRPYMYLIHTAGPNM
jgi:hypothetical protein